MKRSNLSVGKILLFVWTACLLQPIAALSQSAAELGPPPNLIVGGGFNDDTLQETQAEQARTSKTLSSEKTRYKSRRDMAKTGGKAKTTPKTVSSEMNLDEQPLTEGVDMTTEALDAIFFRDIARQENLTYQELFETAGALEKEVNSIGEIIDGEPSNQITFSSQDIVYINRGSANGVARGMKFAVLKREKGSVYHPVSGSNLGRMVTLEGVLEVQEASVKIAKAKVIKSFSSLERGDLLIPYEKPLLPSLDPDTPVLDKDVKGYIVRAREPKRGMSKGDVIFIDVGSSRGVDVGDVFIVIDNRAVVRNDGRAVQGIPKIIGRVKVLTTRKSTATALVTNSRSVIYPGDKIEFSPN
ncbi:MAG: hypothetical protein OEZ04_05710 [Nitrospinota bacterium]|nr:hypothetical protein [Nitrospinota bacterium]